MFHPIDNVYLFKKDVFVEKLLEKRVNSYNVEALRDLSKRVEDVCDLLNREIDRVCKEMEARSRQSSQIYLSMVLSPKCWNSMLGANCSWLV